MHKSRVDEAQERLDKINHPNKAAIPREEILKILQLLIDEARDDSKIIAVAKRVARNPNRTVMNRSVDALRAV